jgi:hypothetical protein
VPYILTNNLKTKVGEITTSLDDVFPRLEVARPSLSLLNFRFHFIILRFLTSYALSDVHDIITLVL